jgi:hypothetical protein
MMCRFVAVDYSRKQYVGDKQHRTSRFSAVYFKNTTGDEQPHQHVFVYFQGCNNIKYFVISVKCLFQKDVGIELMLHKQK